MQLSFDARKNDIEIKQKLKELDEETDAIKKRINSSRNRSKNIW